MKKYIVILTLLVLCLLVFIYLNQFNLKVEIKKLNEVNSLDNKYSALLYSVDGGATTSHSVYIRILEKGEKFEVKKEEGIVFGAKIFEPEINLMWSNHTLIIKCINCVVDNIFLKKYKYKDVIIKYN